MGGGIIINRAKVLLVAATDPCVYDTLAGPLKTIVDEIDAKDPASRTQDDIDRLLLILQEECGESV